MAMVYSTGPVENAAGNASMSAWIKVLNNNEAEPVEVFTRLFRLNGEKQEVASTTFFVSPQNSEFHVFNLEGMGQFEIQVRVNPDRNTLVSIWGKDADGDLTATHRFLPGELTPLSMTAENPSRPPSTLKRKTSAKNRSR